MIISLTLALALQSSSFDAAAGVFAGCLTNTVKMGMMTKMKPADFAAGFAKSCKAEEARFRAEAVKLAIEGGRTQADAETEVDANIANGRRIFAADQAAYVANGEVPR